MTNAKNTNVQACKLVWRSDGQQMVVVQADDACSQENGSLVRFPLTNPDDQKQVAAVGDNPAFQPLQLGQ